MSSVDPVVPKNGSADNGTAVQNPVNWTLWLLFIASLGLTLLVFQSGLAEMVKDWDSEEYSHGYMIPLVAATFCGKSKNKFPLWCITELG